jgi:hypothetical protein
MSQDAWALALGRLGVFVGGMLCWLVWITEGAHDEFMGKRADACTGQESRPGEFATP